MSKSKANSPELPLSMATQSRNEMNSITNTPARRLGCSAWLLLMPVLLIAAFCVVFGPFLWEQAIVRRLEANDVQVVYVNAAGYWNQPWLRAVPGFQHYGKTLILAFVNCDQPQTRAELPQIARDLRSLRMEIDVDLTGSTDLTRDLSLLRSSRIGTLKVRQQEVRARDIAIVQTLADLKELHLSNCQLDNPAFEEISRLNQLTILTLDGTSISDSSLLPLRRLNKLVFLSLSNTQVSDDAKAQLQDALPHLELTDD